MSYADFPTHPLCHVPESVLEVARDVMRQAIVWKDVDVDMAEPLADAVVADLVEAGYITWPGRVEPPSRRRAISTTCWGGHHPQCSGRGCECDCHGV